MEDLPTPEEIENLPTPEEMEELPSPEQVTKQEEISKLESLARGAGQGVTLGFGDELAAGVGAALDRPVQYISDTLAGVPEDLRGESEESKLLDRYERMRDEERTKNLEAQEANPGTYLTGEIGGALSLPLGALGQGVKGTRAAKALAASRLGKLTGAGVQALEKAPLVGKTLSSSAKALPSVIAESAVYGAGQADEFKEIPQAAIDSAMLAGGTTVALPVALQGVTKAMSKLGSKASKGAISLSLGMPMKEVDELFKNPEKYGMDTRQINEIAEDLANRAGKIGDEASDFSQQARNVLDTDKSESAFVLADYFDSVARGLNKEDKAARKAVEQFRDIILSDFPQGVSQADKQNIVDRLSKMAYKQSGDKKTSEVAKVFRNLRRKVSEDLKTANPQYKELMDESSRRMEKLSKLNKKLGLEDEYVKQFDEIGGLTGTQKKAGFKNIDTAINKIEGLAKEDKFEIKKLLQDEEMKKLLDLGDEFFDEIDALKFQKEAERKGYSTRAITVAKTILGTVAGASMVGASPILAAAATVPYFSGKAVKNPKLITKARKFSNAITEKVPELTGRAVEAGIAPIAASETAEEMAKNKETRMKLNSDRLFEASNEDLESLSKSLENNGQAGAEFSRVLNQAIEDEDRRDTILFGLQQQPGFREMLKKIQDKN